MHIWCTFPNESGSGGGSDFDSGYPGGNGGGLVRIITGTLVLDGNIFADGGAGSWYSYYGVGGSGGSGGGIKVEAATLSGNGNMYARGGSGTGRGGGGGGRIAIYSPGMTFLQSHILFSGGSGSSNGGTGTYFLQ